MNGKLDRGEAADVTLVLRNAGSAAPAVEARLVSRSPLLTVIDPDGAFPAAGEADSTRSSVDRFRLEAAPGAPIEEALLCDLLVSGSGYVDTIEVPIIVGDSMNLPGGPDGYGYVVYDRTDSCYARRPDYDWFELLGIGTGLPLGGDETVTVPLPDGFGAWRFYGQDYDSISICSNGWVCPGTSDRVDFVNVRLPYPNSPPRIIAAVWDDLDPTAGGHVLYYHDSTRHRFIVEYDSVSYFGHTEDWERVQFHVYDRSVATPTGDNSMSIHFKTANDFVTATVGLQNGDGSTGLCYYCNEWYPRTSAPLAAQTAVRIETFEPTAVAEGGPAAPACRLLVRPSVSSGPVRVTRAPGQWGPAEARVYASDGRVVRRLGPPEGPAGWTWDGRDDAGAVAGPGTYFIRAATASGGDVAKVVLTGR